MIIRENFSTDRTENETVHITCESDEPIHWLNPWATFPYLQYAIYDWNEEEAHLYMHAAKYIAGRYSVMYDHVERNTTYRATLTLFNVNYGSIGFYFCAKNSSTFLRPNDLFQSTRFKRKRHKYKKVITHLYVGVKGILTRWTLPRGLYYNSIFLNSYKQSTTNWKTTQNWCFAKRWLQCFDPLQRTAGKCLFMIN